MALIPPVIGPDIREWGRSLNIFLQRNLGRVPFKVATDNPSENGVLLWDDDKGYLVVSKNNAFDPVVSHSIQHAHGTFERTTDATVSSTNTAYTITFDTTVDSAGGVALGSPTSRMTVTKSGVYRLVVSAQLVTQSNKGKMYLWIAKNGTNVDLSSRRSSIESSDDVRNFVVDHTLDLVADDYVEVKYAATTTDFSFEAAAATSFAPSASSVTANLTMVEFDE